MVSPDQVLSLILAVASPGNATNSHVALPECDQVCQATPACAEWPQRLVCAPPRWSGRRRAWVRAETAVEGQLRYRTIATAIATTANNPPPEWIWSARELALGLVVIARHESAFWLDVQLGSLRGPAGEVCLLQINAGTGYSRAERELMLGASPFALGQCLHAGARLLGIARAACRANGPRWFHAAVAAYGSGQGCRGRWANGRAWMYHRLEQRAQLWPVERPARPRGWCSLQASAGP